MTTKPVLIDPPAPAAAEETAPSELPAGGAYIDGKRIAGPEPDYGWVMVDGKRVRAPGPGA